MHGVSVHVVVDPRPVFQVVGAAEVHEELVLDLGPRVVLILLALLLDSLFAGLHLSPIVMSASNKKTPRPTTLGLPELHDENVARPARDCLKREAPR